MTATLLIWFVSIVIYLAGFVPTAVLSTRYYARIPYCHRDNDHMRRYCLRNHPNDANTPGRPCWRYDEAAIGVGLASAGSATALVWPIAFIPFVIMYLADRDSQRPRPLSGHALRQLEKEAGINESRI